MRAILVFGLVIGLASPALAREDRSTRDNIEAASVGIGEMIGQPALTTDQKYSPDLPPGEADTDPCHHDKFCEVYAADEILVQATGWIVDALPSTRVAPATYRQVCAGILEGLGEGDIHPDLAREAVDQAFAVAASRGRFEAELASVEMKVKPALSGDLLECSFWRRW